MVERIRNEYEVSSEGAVRHLLVPYARMTDATPTPSNPAQLIALTAGTQVGGTVLTIDASVSLAVVDMTCGMVYLQEVENTLTYNGGNPATWGPINIGDRIYYDASATQPAGVKLSTSPLDQAGNANALFGTAVFSERVTYPLGGAATALVEVAVMQRGAGA